MRPGPALIEKSTAPALAAVGNFAATEVADETARRERLFSLIDQSARYVTLFGLGWLVPLLRIAAGDNA